MSPAFHEWCAAEDPPTSSCGLGGCGEADCSQHRRAPLVHRLGAGFLPNRSMEKDREEEEEEKMSRCEEDPGASYVEARMWRQYLRKYRCRGWCCGKFSRSKLCANIYLGADGTVAVRRHGRSGSCLSSKLCKNVYVDGGNGGGSGGEQHRRYGSATLRKLCDNADAARRGGRAAVRGRGRGWWGRGDGRRGEGRRTWRAWKGGEIDGGRLNQGTTRHHGTSVTTRTMSSSPWPREQVEGEGEDNCTCQGTHSCHLHCCPTSSMKCVTRCLGRPGTAGWPGLGVFMHEPPTVAANAARRRPPR